MQHGRAGSRSHLCKAPRAELVEKESPQPFNGVSRERKNQRGSGPARVRALEISTGLTGNSEKTQRRADVRGLVAKVFAVGEGANIRG